MSQSDFTVSLETLKQQLDILALTETRFLEDDNLAEKELQDYQTIQSRHRQNAKKRSGGVALFVKSALVYHLNESELDKECYLIEV